MDPKSLYSLKDKFNAKRLQVNISKIKILLCKPPAECAVTPSKYLCGVCKKGVGKNSIFCHHSKSWIHPRCSNIKGHLRSDPNLKCQKFCQEKENTPVTCWRLSDSVTWEMLPANWGTATVQILHI